SCEGDRSVVLPSRHLPTALSWKLRSTVKGRVRLSYRRHRPLQFGRTTLYFASKGKAKEIIQDQAYTEKHSCRLLCRVTHALHVGTSGEAHFVARCGHRETARSHWQCVLVRTKHPI